MWLGQMKIFRTMLCTLCQNCLSCFNMQLCSFHCINRYSICILVIFPMYFYHLLWLPCVPQGVPVDSCGQPVPISTKCDQMSWQLVNSIKNGLNTKRSLHSRLNFVFLVQLLISLWLVMTCVIPSQMAYSFIIYNASHSMHCSSVEAYLLWKCCSPLLISDTRILVITVKCDA